eukprot:gene7837-12311_t
MVHTILLIQYSQNNSSKTYFDFESVQEAMNGVCQMYEKKLKKENPTKSEITYGLNDLLKYIDELHDICCLT